MNIQRNHPKRVDNLANSFFNLSRNFYKEVQTDENISDRR